MEHFVEDNAKRRLTDRIEIITAINILREQGYDNEDLIREITRIFYVDLDTYNEIIKRLARRSEAAASDADIPKGSIQMVLDEANIILPIADVVDIDQERARLKKEIEKAEANIERIDKMLKNESFLAKAPDEVVEEKKEERAEAENVKAKLAQALKQLEAA